MIQYATNNLSTHFGTQLICRIFERESQMQATSFNPPQQAMFNNKNSTTLFRPFSNGRTFNPVECFKRIKTPRTGDSESRLKLDSIRDVVAWDQVKRLAKIRSLTGGCLWRSGTMTSPVWQQLAVNSGFPTAEISCWGWKKSGIFETRWWAFAGWHLIAPGRRRPACSK